MAKVRVNAVNPETGERQVGILEKGKIKFFRGKKIPAKKLDYKKV